MKSPNRFVKILVVLIFIGLITGFVAYRSGAFESPGGKKAALEVKAGEYPGRPAANLLTANPDTSKPIAKDSSAARKRLFSSSKSTILADELIWQDGMPAKKLIQPDTGTIIPDSSLKRIQDQGRKGNSPADSAIRKPKETAIFYGTKSGPVIRPETKPDTMQKQKP